MFCKPLTGHPADVAGQPVLGFHRFFVVSDGLVVIVPFVVYDTELLYAYRKLHGVLFAFEYVDGQG